MSEGKKYNTFAGVFTPSILTILGVIMYMRLSWVVGEAGLLGALGIIVLAHVISVSTGLSISSIATDKKIKTGGIYYILSRSLGLPMGGAIGIALFTGTALSISLYLIGFAESFLAIDAIREFTGLSADINGFRIVGTVAILVLVIIAFISTSLAIKLQFFILIAIGLSLLSIGFGLFQNAKVVSTPVAMFSHGDFPLEYIFAIFFPAVTGFTAGVAMSGDLKDPKKAIPKGTILAIGVGFIIYISLAIVSAMFIDTEVLVSDYNIFTKIAWFTPLVIAGVWGATLSSALGGILGGPRILQAIAKDKMSPKLFGKGYGESNEPRNALLLIFAIAEGGILIGQLDVIAGVVSMFYLASYGFINLSYVLEKWASTDFRPSFRIHILVGIIGFIASFAVMFKMDMLSMMASLLIMGGLYFLLKRREIRSESGDVWQSVWASIIRRTLAIVEHKTIEERNWKPNIILFSGIANQRPHLLSFGKSLIGQYGLLSNFNLHENKDSSQLFAKHEQSVNDEDKRHKGVFTRQQSCKNIYEGIEVIAQTYGFSGVEPNTVLMGWGRQTEDPLRFVQMLNTISSLDLNILLLDYDKTNGFGEKKVIDIWWRGAGNHGNLSLTLTKFLTNSIDWNQARIRLLIVNYENNKQEMIHKRALEYLENIRIDAELKIINNEIEQKAFYDIMKAESQKSDLIFLGIPEIEAGKELEFVESTSDLMHNIGSVVLVKASTLFKNLQLGVSSTLEEDANDSYIAPINAVESYTSELNIPNNVVVANEINLLHKSFNDNFETYYSSLYQQIAKDNDQLLSTIEETYFNAFNSIRTRYTKFDQQRQIYLAKHQHSQILSNLDHTIEQYTQENMIEHAHMIETHWPVFAQNIKSYFSKLPKRLMIQYEKTDFEASEKDNRWQKFYKWKRRVLGFKTAKYKIKFYDLVNENLLSQHEDFLLKHFKHFGILQVQFSIELLKLVKSIDNSFIILIDKFQKNEIAADVFEKQKSELNQAFLNIKNLNQDILNSLNNEFKNYQNQKFNDLTQLLNGVHPNALIKPEDDLKKKVSLAPILDAIPALWSRNQQLIYNATLTEIRLLSLKSNIKNAIYKLSEAAKFQLQQAVVEYYKTYLLSPDKADSDQWADLNSVKITATLSSLYEESYRTLDHTFADFPEHIDIFEDDKLNTFEEQQFTNIPSSQISAKQLVDYLVKNKIQAPLVHQFEALSKNIAEKIALLNESKRLISFAVIHQADEDDIDLETSPADLIKDSQVKIENEIKAVEDLIDEIDMEAQSLFSDISQSLSYYSFTKTASNLKQYIQQQKKLSRFELIKFKVSRVVHYLKEQQARLIYSQSKALILKKQLENSTIIDNPVKLLLDLTYQLTPNAQVMSQLPFYYKQLFSSNQILHKDFWVGRADEIASAQMAINRYHQGYKGALAIVGPSGIGKSFFSYYISTLTNAPKVIHIDPLFDDLPQKKDLIKAFQKVTEKEGDIEQILNDLPKNSLIIFENLELWWSSHLEGTDLMDYIFKLIAKHLDQFLFIVNANDIMFKQMIGSKAYAHLFLNLIHLKNIDSKHLKEIVLNRHKASGLKLKMDQTFLNDWSEAKWARLFNKIHKVTHGNIEASLQLWLSSIQKFEDKAIEIKLPQIDLHYLNALDLESRVILKQFVIHKRLSLNVLAKIMQEDREQVKQRLKFLVRSGLLIKRKSVYIQNAYIKYYITNFLFEKGML